MGSSEGREPQTDKTPASKSLYRSIFKITTFSIVFYQSNLSTLQRKNVSKCCQQL
jgi:hypothetical protein